jgi:histidine triad (HIT) family protein
MNPEQCLFCKISKGEIKATILYQDAAVTAFRDIHPVAPTHVLIVPNKHIQSINEMEAEDELILGHLFFVAKKITQQENIAESGYRSIINTGVHGGQTVSHLHLHIIGGKPLREPMG